MPAVEVFASNRKNIFGIAKKSLKRSLARCQRKILRLGHRHAILHEPLIAVDETPKLALARRKFVINDDNDDAEKKESKKSSPRPQIILPYLMLRSDVRGNFELHSDQLDQLTKNVLNECRGVKYLGDAIGFQLENASTILKTIVSCVDGVKELVLDTAWNSMVMQTIIDYYHFVNDISTSPKRFHLENLSIVGSTRLVDMDVLCSLLMLTRRSLEALRMRYCKLHSPEQALRLWTSVSQCSKLSQLQYEPYKTDTVSRPYLVDVVSRKPMLTSLILTDIDGLSHADVLSMAKSGSLTELAVIGDQISPAVYTASEARRILANLDSLLLQLDTKFDLTDCQSRSNVVRILQQLPKSSLLEVIHSTSSNAAEIAKVISYWLRLANDTERTVMLKLENCSQEKQDAAVGRVLRKCQDAQKLASSENGISLSIDCGEVVVLDRKTWFGDDM